MDDTTRERLHQALLAKRGDIEASLETNADSRSVVELDQSSVGRVSRVDALQAQQLALATAQQRRRELSRIDAALGRMADGRYGECLDCGEDIAEKRLVADPANPTCIDCASAKGR